MKLIGILLISLAVLALTACSSSDSSVKVRQPLPVINVPVAVKQSTEQGTRAYQKRQYEIAKTYFEEAVAAAPASGEAHYNLGLVLFALGADGEARDHFIEAANLAPGNKVIWDSPALRPYGDPEPTMKKKTTEKEFTTRKPSFGGMGKR
jgi:Flp pilus assembly protein TadD